MERGLTLGAHPGTPVEPFTLNVPGSVLDDLRDRLARTRWPDQVDGAGWEYGTELSYLRELVQYWHTRFDWRKQERLINELPQFRARVDGLNLHFVHARGQGSEAAPAGGDARVAEHLLRDAQDHRAAHRSGIARR